MNAKAKLAGRSWLNSLITLVIASIALASIVGVQRFQLNQTSIKGSTPQQAEQQEVWRLRLLKHLPTFGFNNLIADWTFLNFLQYYGDDDARAQTGYSLSPEYFDIITRLDPRFLDTYLFLSSSLSYQLGQPKLAVEFMDRGTAALSPAINPKSFQVWRLKGLDQLLLLGDIPGSIRSHEMAANWTKNTPYSNLSPLFQQTADFLRTDPNSVLVRFNAWASVYAQAMATGDRQTQERAKQEILALGGQIRENNGQPEFVLPNPQSFPAKAK